MSIGKLFISWEYANNQGERVGYTTPVNQFKEIMQREQIDQGNVLKITIDGEEYEPTEKNVQAIMDHDKEEKK